MASYGFTLPTVAVGPIENSTAVADVPVPVDHPLRPMRTMVDAVLTELSPQFNRLYSRVGRASIRS